MLKITILLAIFIVWHYIGAYSYIHVMNAHKKEHKIKWRRREVRQVPLFGLLGPFAYVVGSLIRKAKPNPRYEY